MHKKILIESTTYAPCKYLIPASLTASQTHKARVARGRKPGMEEKLTYLLLIKTQENLVKLKQLNAQTFANRASVLRKFIAANFQSLNDVVGSEMRLQHPEAVERFVNSLTTEGKSSRAITNILSALRFWKAAVVSYDIDLARNTEKPTPFVQALKQLLEDKSITQVAKQTSTSTHMLRSWLLGKTPRASNVQYICRLESFFGLARNSLVSICGAKPPGTRENQPSETKPIYYRSIIGEITKISFCLKPGIDSPLRAQWHDFLTYKTAPTLTNRGSSNNVRSSGKKRTRRGKWRISPCPLTVPTDSNWWAFLPYGFEDPKSKPREVASARIAWAKTSAYLGWLRLEPAAGGVGLPASQVETIAWLAHPQFLERFLDWTKSRVKSRNSGATQFLGFIASLVRKREGYLRQSPELAETLPKIYRWESWDEMCDETFEITEELTSAYKDELKVARDSFEPIMHILRLPQPMDAIVDMVHRMRADRPVGCVRNEAVWSRDLVLIKLLASNPLRKRNLAHLTWRQDNTGHIYQREDKSWWIKIHKTEFKNTRGAAGEREYYECQIHPSAWKDIESYLYKFRPRLMREFTDLFFLTSVEGQLKARGQVKHVPWVDIGTRVKNLTKVYLHGSPGIGCHAFRHIVATSILKASGGDFKTAALVLYDRVSTVEKHYAFLTADDGNQRMSELLIDQFGRM